MHNFLFQQGHQPIHPNGLVWLAENDEKMHENTK
jgi:hypothetical protein